MTLAKTYNPKEVEPRLKAFWQEMGVYHFDPDVDDPIYSIDTPPPTVSGYLHLGHVYSYSHPDFIARFWRMKGYNVFYPMGYDDNGLPTEKLVEKRLGLRASETGLGAFVEKCLQVSKQAEQDYQALWQRLGLSIDWRYTYRTIDDDSRRTSQLSFIDLYRNGLAYRREAPAIWCPECQTSIAQAELNDLDRESEFVTLRFSINPSSPVLEVQGERPSPSGRRVGGESELLPIATTRPELLPACVAIFVHPQDDRYQELIGRSAIVPLFGQTVPILADPAAEPEKGTGAVMCCTFGDTTDVAWWHTHKLPLVEAIDRAGRMTQAAGAFAGLTLVEARRQIKAALQESNLLISRQPTLQSIRVHERCDTPVEYILVKQWFVKVLDFKERLLKAGEQVKWHPEHMKARYQAWVENLNWDWCLTRQRYFGVPFPVWYCRDCGEAIMAEESQLPVDPTNQQPPTPCPRCGSTSVNPDKDFFDTWATSSLTPQIVGKRLQDPTLYSKVFPFSLRPQAHEIIRTWAFYTIVKSIYHFDTLPWTDVLISGWGLAGEGMGKISKSRGGGPMAPMEMIERYSADAVRYWAASTGPGKDAIISEEKIQMGAKLVTKLWNVARFSERFILPSPLTHLPPTDLSPADRWILSRTQKLIHRATGLLQDYDYAAAKSEVETFFWTELADNYLEMAKQRLYEPVSSTSKGARFTLSCILLTVLKLLAPFLPYVTDEIYQGLFENREPIARSIHRSKWPVADSTLEDDAAEHVGRILVEIATTVRRYKSERNLPLGSELHRLQLATTNPTYYVALREAVTDLSSITRAQQVEVSTTPLVNPISRLNEDIDLSIDPERPG